MLDSIALAMTSIATPFMALLLVAGTLLGIIVGAIPGLGPAMMIALILPFTLPLQPIEAIALLGAVYCAAMYGGSIPAILINTPGTPAGAATTFDGYPLAVKGEAGRALGVATVSSACGGILSLIALLLMAPLLAHMAYQFGAPEYFSLNVFALSMLATVGLGSPLKNLIGGFLGVLIATVGTDLTTGIDRFTFGVPELSDGVNFIPALIGLFAGAELLRQSNALNRVRKLITASAVKLPSRADMRRIRPTILRSSIIGTLVGVLPAEGGTIASLIGYSEAKRWSKNKEEFGHGAIEGIAGAEAANNAATGGAMVPTLALGIPGSGVTAVILVAMLIHGLRPGPLLFAEQPEFLYAIFFAMLAANVLFLVVGLAAAKYIATVTLIPNTFLWPAVLLFAVVGSYALKQSMLDVWIMMIFSLVGFVGHRFGFSPAPVVMGLVLGGMVEQTLRQSLLIFEMKWWLFLDRPIAMVFLVLTLAALLGPMLVRKLIRRPA